MMDTMENHREQQKKDQDSKRYPIPAHLKWIAEFKSDDYGWSKKYRCVFGTAHGKEVHEAMLWQSWDSSS